MKARTIWIVLDYDPRQIDAGSVALVLVGACSGKIHGLEAWSSEKKVFERVRSLSWRIVVMHLSISFEHIKVGGINLRKTL